MLVRLDGPGGLYHIVVNNATNGAEIASDLSYLPSEPGGVLLIDMTHMSAPLSLESREAYRPGYLGYQPTLHLLEVTAAIAEYWSRYAICPQRVEVILPTRDSRVGRYLRDMDLDRVLNDLGMSVSEGALQFAEFGEDDSKRQNLIPVTNIVIKPDGPDFSQLSRLRSRVESTFRKALWNYPDLADTFTGVVSEAVDNLVEYGNGGFIGGLYYPRAGEVEITLVNRQGGFGGDTPDEELAALIGACEGVTRRAVGGGNGIRALSKLAAACYGTVAFRNGSATVRLPPDGTLMGFTEETGIPTPGAYVTVLLQLLPTEDSTDTPALDEYRAVLNAALLEYMDAKRGNGTTGGQG